MTSRRLVIVIRQFWPHSGSAQLAVSDLAVAFREAGYDIEIVTAKMEKNWPSYFELREIPVTRVSKPTIGPWSAFRYQRSLGQYFSSMPMPDGVIVFGIDEEIATVAKSLGGQTPIVVRADYRITPFPSWPSKLNKKTRLGIEKVESIVVGSEFAKQYLVDAGITQHKIQIIPDHVFSESEKARSEATQLAARRSLSDAHPILTTEADQPMVVTGAPIDEDGGMLDLVKAWSTVQEAFPNARLWVLGDGPNAGDLWNLIKSRELVYSVILPGFFDEPSEVFHASDLYVHPLRTPRACNFLLRALANGLCTVVTESDYTNKIVSPGESALMTPPSNPNALAEAIIHALGQRKMRIDLGLAGKKLIERRFLIQDLVRKYESLFGFCEPEPEIADRDVSVTER